MDIEITDGGRWAAGFQGEARDCVTRAISVATGKPYAEVYAELSRRARTERLKRKRRTARYGVFKTTYRPYLEELGFVWVTTMGIGTGCRVHLRSEELPSGTLIVRVSRHLVAVIDGTIYDSHDPSRGGTRCVYGYYRRGGDR